KRPQLLSEGGAVQTGPERLARILRGGAAADPQAAHQETCASSISLLRSPQSQHPSLRAPAESPSRLSPAKSVKRPLHPAFSSCNTPKKQRLDLNQDPATPPHPADSRGPHVRVEFAASRLCSPLKLGGSFTTVTASPKTERTVPPSPLSRTTVSENPCTETHFTNSQHKKKHKKHKDKERERLKPDWSEGSPDQKHNPENLKDVERESTPDSLITAEQLPGCFMKYNPITSTEQRQQYQEDFCAEYDEYKALHDHIRTITDIFIQLASKISTLSPGTQEYKRFPGYRDEKKRCQYLHQKLSHIKSLITDYDRAHAPT
uniref:Si:ch211-13k12.2 n=1 Tax=Neogobius melanostomus TaxID=47308 RepID=A0A8C6THY8_9GOBI